MYGILRGYWQIQDLQTGQDRSTEGAERGSVLGGDVPLQWEEVWEGAVPPPLQKFFFQSWV